MFRSCDGFRQSSKISSTTTYCNCARRTARRELKYSEEWPWFEPHETPRRAVFVDASNLYARAATRSAARILASRAAGTRARIPARGSQRGEAGVHSARVEGVETGAGGARTASSQLPTLLCRPADLAYRHVDADGGAVVAGISHDQFGVAARHRRFLQPDSRVPHGANRRHRGRPLQSPARGDRHANRRR